MFKKYVIGYRYSFEQLLLTQEIGMIISNISQKVFFKYIIDNKSCLNSIDIMDNALYSLIRNNDKIKYGTFSYSEQWRYKGSKKLRQPLMMQEGANLSELFEQ